MNIAARHIGPEHPPYVIAEIGVNHDGSVDRATELVRAARAAGADAIKLQLFRADSLLSRAARLALYQKESGSHDPFDMLRSLELSVQQMRGVVDETHRHRMHAIVTVFSVELVQSASALEWDAYKTASPDIINRPLVEALMHTGKPIIVSAGAATLADVANASRWLGGHPHLLMQCVSAYPTTDDDASLAGRHAMLDVNPNALGYSDHTINVDTGALAVASGACILEKHLTYDRRAAGPDHAASLDPAAFAEYVRLAHRAWRMLGPRRKEVLEAERDVHEVSRQSLTSTRDLAAGHVLSRTDITIKRPGIGLPPALLNGVAGRRLRKPVPADMPITADDLA